MGQLVYILGKSGTGKSFSMRNFPKDKYAVVNVQGKILPFKGAGSIEQSVTDNSDNIIKALKIYAKNYKSIVIDDYQYTMANEFMRRSYERGFDKFTEIGRHAWDIANAVSELPNDVIVYILCHTDRDDEGNEKIKTIGKLLDEKICLEGMSTIVLKTNVTDGVYSFLTQNSGKDTVKSPAGMFPTYAIENDLYYVDQKIRNYYELGEFITDEEMAEIDEAAKKVDFEKPAANGKRRRAAKTEEPKEAVNGSNDEENAQKEEVKTTRGNKRTREEVQAANTKAVVEAGAEDGREEIPIEEVEMPKTEKLPRRTRKDRTAEAKDDQEHFEEAQAEESEVKTADATPAPTRRRRRV